MVHKDYYLYKRGKRHPNYHIPRDKHKEELIKSTSFKEYKQLQKQARNEVNKIIKEHPEYAFQAYLGTSFAKYTRKENVMNKEERKNSKIGAENPSRKTENCRGKEGSKSNPQGCRKP